ncbi:hypothetical protein AVEN_146960-1 [Araneus ventricosus]|uniref:Transposable element Tc1 transposase n=1 Tax=Araneus ventricosus TaxID=182803 RepID=A0A4Y2UXE7_ARAVE|nr:hypothetical protein AVEN_146960-1 [Araneus ventricosus]
MTWSLEPWRSYPARWIGHGGPVAWPPRSPDLNPLDFFFWGHMKSSVYETPVDFAEDLAARIVVPADKINAPLGIFERVRQSFLRRTVVQFRFLARQKS